MKLKIVIPREEQIDEYMVEIHEERFAVWHAPPAFDSPDIWIEYAAATAKQFREALGMPVVVVPPGSRLEVMEVVPSSEEGPTQASKE